MVIGKGIYLGMHVYLHNFMVFRLKLQLKKSFVPPNAIMWDCTIMWDECSQTPVNPKSVKINVA